MTMTDERREEIKAALTMFDPDDASQWTQAGKPILEVFDEFMTSRPSRTEVDLVAPKFTRETAVEQAQAQLDGLLGGTDPKPEAPAPRAAVKKAVDILDRPLAEIYQDESLLDEYLKRLKAEEVDARRRRQKADDDLAKIARASDQASRVKGRYDIAAKRKLSPALERKQHIEKLHKRQIEKATRRREVLAGLSPQEVADAVDPRSPIDKKYAGRRRASVRGS